jgi:hypothetical protein
MSVTFMGIVDLNDDTVDRYVVWHYRFDESTSHFRKIPLAAFSTSREARRLFEVESQELLKKKESGLADAREYISSDQKKRGHNRIAREMRSFLRLIKSKRGTE